MGDTFVIVILILTLLFVVATFFLMFILEQKRKRRACHDESQVVKQVLKDKRFIDELSRTISDNVMRSIDNVTTDCRKGKDALSEEQVKKIVKLVVEQMQAHEVKPESAPEQPAIQEPIKTVLYASAANENKVFKVYDKFMQGRTVYKLELKSENLASFSVVELPDYTSLFDSPSYLDNATESEGLGRNRIRTEAPGTAKKDAEGQWRVEKNAKIIFE